MTTEQIASLIGVIFASAGFWELIKFIVSKKFTKREDIIQKLNKIEERLQLNEEMTLGNLYDRTKYLAEKHIKRGYISTNDYEDWLKYLYTPYHNAGGDGTIDRLKAELDSLPIRSEDVIRDTTKVIK